MSRLPNWLHVSGTSGVLKRVSKHLSEYIIMVTNILFLLTSADLKPGCKGNSDKSGYSIQGLVAKVKDTVGNG